MTEDVMSKKVFDKLNHFINRSRLIKLYTGFCDECKQKITNYSLANQYKPIPYKEILCKKCLVKSEIVLNKISKSLEDVE